MDGLARRYRVLPSDLLKLGLDEISFNYRVAAAGATDAELKFKQREAKMKQRR